MRFLLLHYLQCILTFFFKLMLFDVISFQNIFLLLSWELKSLNDSNNVLKTYIKTSYNCGRNFFTSFESILHGWSMLQKICSLCQQCEELTVIPASLSEFKSIYLVHKPNVKLMLWVDLKCQLSVLRRHIYELYFAISKLLVCVCFGLDKCSK